MIDGKQIRLYLIKYATATNSLHMLSYTVWISRCLHGQVTIAVNMLYVSRVVYYG